MAQDKILHSENACVAKSALNLRERYFREVAAKTERLGL